MAVGARVAQAARPRVVTEAIVRPLATVVALNLLCRSLWSAAVRAVGARVAHGRQEIVVAFVVVAVSVVIVVVAVEPSIVIVPLVASFSGAIVAHAIKRPLARIITIVVVDVSLDFRYNDALVLEDDLTSTGIDLGDVHVLRVALLGHVSPRVPFVEEQHDFSHFQGLNFVCRALRGRKRELGALKRKACAANDQALRVRGEHDAFALLDLRVLEDVRHLDALTAGANCNRVLEKAEHGKQQG